MARRARALFATLAALILAVLATAGGGVAQPTTCAVQPFGFDVLDSAAVQESDTYKLEFTATGSTMLVCPTGVVAIDVWEHAVIAVPVGGGPVRGVAQVEVTPPTGDAVSFGGRVDGTAFLMPIEDVFSLKVVATSQGGARLVLEERAMVDRAVPNPLESLGLTRGRVFIAFTSAG